MYEGGEEVINTICGGTFSNQVNRTISLTRAVNLANIAKGKFLRMSI